MSGVYDTPETILVIWYRPFSLFIGVFWSLAFAKVFEYVFSGAADMTESVLSFVMVVLLFVFMGVYQHWLLQFAKQEGRVGRNLLKCILLCVAVALGYALVSLNLINAVSGKVAIPNWGAWAVGATIFSWCMAGLGGMWYYHVAPRQYEEKYGVAD